jgi:hypothetical protein
MVTGKIKGFTRKTTGKSARKGREETFFIQMSLLQNR